MASAEKSSYYGDDTLMPFGQYKGERLGDVPDDYLRWWFSQHTDRAMIELEIHSYGYPKKAIAIQNIKLHDYIKGRFSDGNKIQDSDNNAV